MLDRAGRVEDAGRRAGASGASDEARAAAQELVASTLVQPILAQLRETNNAEAPFGPGQWEKTFGPMMDAEIATRIVRASNWGLIDRMTEGFTRPKASSATPDAREAGNVHT
jgi:Rod binding domain-containing protein